MAALAVVSAGSAARAEDWPLASHRALYSLSLLDAKPSSGIVGASGIMGFELAQTCDGWTNEQRYKMHLVYQENGPVDLGATYVTWESRDGTSFRFDQRKTRNGQLDEELHGTATHDAKGGKATFDKPKTQSFDLPAGVIFPTEHTAVMLRAAKSGKPFVTAEVFDGTSLDGASLVAATFAHAEAAEATQVQLTVQSPLVSRPSWRAHLGFFPDAAKDDTSDYDLGMLMLDNGVGGTMILDYGDYKLQGTLTRIEAVKTPKC